MSEECTHDCSNCSAACSSRDAAPQHDAPNPHSRVKKVIGVVSGKGGVGKSMTSALLACAMARRGYHCGILDADITGPSIPKLFGIHGDFILFMMIRQNNLALRRFTTMICLLFVLFKV